MDINKSIGNNIIKVLKSQNKKQTDLALYLNTSKQVVNNMLNGSRVISAIELQKISKFLNTSMENLINFSQNTLPNEPIKVFMGSVSKQETKDDLKTIEEIADLICYYAKITENSKRVLETWEF